jgi:hypothetical protein
MMVEIDSSEQSKMNNLVEDTKKENALKNARRAMENEDYEKAEEYYNIVQMEEPENWEANFYSTYSKAMQTNLNNISNAVYSITNCIKTVFKDIKKLDDNVQQNKAIKQISTDLSAFTTVGYNNVINFYNSQIAIYGNNSHFFANAVSDAKLKCANNILPFADMLAFFGRELISEFGGNEFTNSINIQSHETAVKTVDDLYKSTNNRFYDSNSNDILEKYTDELKKIKPPLILEKEEVLGIPEKKTLFADLETKEDGGFSFLTKPLAPDGCGCGWCPAFVTAPIFIIVAIAFGIIMAIITPESNSTSASNIGDQKIKARVQLEQAIKTNLREPKSYQNIVTDAWPLEEYIYVKNTFRGKNLYGGYEVCTFVARFNFNATAWEITNNPSSDNGCRAIMIALP